MDQQTLFSCLGGKKEKKHPFNKDKDHLTFYQCVSGNNYWDKVKLYHNTHVLKMISIKKYELKPIDENQIKEEGKCPSN